MDKDKKNPYSYEELSKKYLEKKAEPNKKFNEAKQIASDYQMIVSFIVTILLLIPLGVFLGYKVDQFLKTTPLFILIFSFLGVAAAFRNLFKDATKNPNQQGGRKK